MRVSKAREPFVQFQLNLGSRKKKMYKENMASWKKKKMMLIMNSDRYISVPSVHFMITEERFGWM